MGDGLCGQFGYSTDLHTAVKALDFEPNPIFGKDSGQLWWIPEHFCSLQPQNPDPEPKEKGKLLENVRSPSTLKKESGKHPKFPHPFAKSAMASSIFIKVRDWSCKYRYNKPPNAIYISRPSFNDHW